MATANTASGLTTENLDDENVDKTLSTTMQVSYISVASYTDATHTTYNKQSYWSIRKLYSLCAICWIS